MRDFRERRGQFERQLLFAELAHQGRLFLHEDQFALIDDADTIGHFLGFFDIVRGQNDGHAVFAQATHHLPHVAPQLDINAGSRFIEEENFRLVTERLGDHHAALHAAGELHDLGVALLPEREIAEHFFDVGRVWRKTEETARERHRIDDALEGIGV